jgi:hypothetical protein
MQMEKLEARMPARVRTYLRNRRWEREFTRAESWSLHDPESTIPPEGERLTFHAVWAVEVYTPAHVDRLFERLESLGFGPQRESREAGIREQIERIRSTPRGGTWMNLGFIVPPGSPGFMFDRIDLPLPEGVRCARPALHALTSSVTVLVVQFVLNDDAATAFDALSYETDFKPQARRRRNGFLVSPSDQVKQTKLRELRADVRSRCANWLADQLPGAFASGLGGSPMPTAELVTTEIAVPFARTDDHRSYIDWAGFGFDPFHWQSDEWPHWRLTFDRDEDFIVVAARSIEAYSDERFKDYVADDDLRWAVAYRAHDYLERDLALWGASRLLLAFHARLSTIRDHGVRQRRFESASRRLRTVRDEFLRDALDARVVAAELERYADEKRSFEWNACDWKPSEDLEGREDERFLENLRFRVSENAAALTAAEARLRDGLHIDSSVIGARATVRLTWWVLVVAAATLAVAVVALLVALRAEGKTSGPAVRTVTVTRPTTPSAKLRVQPTRRQRSSPQRSG